MEGRNKYAPSKTALTMAELKANLAEARKGLEKAVRELGDAEAALKWTRDKLVEVEAENRKLKLMILRMTEQGVADGKSDSR